VGTDLDRPLALQVTFIGDFSLQKILRASHHSFSRFRSFFYEESLQCHRWEKNSDICIFSHIFILDPLSYNKICEFLTYCS
jgi:hypothetical protein